MAKVREVIARLEADGWFLQRIWGSHRIFKHPVKLGTVVVPGRTIRGMTCRRALLKRSLPLQPWPADEPLYGSLLSWLRLRPVPTHQMPSMAMRVYLVTLREALAWARPCGYADVRG